MRVILLLNKDECADFVILLNCIVLLYFPVHVLCAKELIKINFTMSKYMPHIKLTFNSEIFKEMLFMLIKLWS